MRADGVFSGGGIKGLAFAGALEAAAEAGYDEWAQLAGTSAGAITAMALAVGYDAQSLRAALDEFDFSKVADYGELGIAEMPINLERLHGATHGKVLHRWIEDLLERAPKPARTFGELEPRSPSRCGRRPRAHAAGCVPGRRRALRGRRRPAARAR